MRSHLSNTEQRPPDGEGLVSLGLGGALLYGRRTCHTWLREEHDQQSSAKGEMIGLRASCERCGDAMDILNHIDRQRLRAVAHRQFVAWTRREVDPYPPRDVLREHQLTVVLLGQPFETASDVDGIPHRGQV